MLMGGRGLLEDIPPFIWRNDERQPKTCQK